MSSIFEFEDSTVQVRRLTKMTQKGQVNLIIHIKDMFSCEKSPNPFSVALSSWFCFVFFFKICQCILKQ